MKFVFLAATDYASPLSGRTGRLAESLAALGHGVVFVELPSTKRAIRTLVRAESEEQGQSPVRVLKIMPLPGYRRLHATPLARWWIGHVGRSLQRRVPDLRDSILIISTPWWSPIVQGLSCRLRCYDYIDHISVQAGPGRERLFQEWDAKLLQSCNLITTVSHTFRQDLSKRFPAKNLHLIPNGVRQEWIGSPLPAYPRESLVHRPDRPIAGFLGSLFEWCHFDLLALAAKALPDVDFILVGPRRFGVSIDALSALPNVQIVPPVPLADAPRVIKAFDVCLIPFKPDIISQCADPLKLYEYCALGKPVVSTLPFRIGDIEPPIQVATNLEEFTTSTLRGISDNTAELRTQRMAFAAKHTWNKRAEMLISAIHISL